jgi:hypothetical protein
VTVGFVKSGNQHTVTGQQRPHGFTTKGIVLLLAFGGIGSQERIKLGSTISGAKQGTSRLSERRKQAPPLLSLEMN